MVNTTPIDQALFRSTHGGWTAVAFVAIVAVGIVDYVTDPRITFSVFYLIPVALAAWYSGRTAAIGASALAAVVWFIAEFALSRLDSSTLVYAWNFCTRLLFLLLVSLLLARLRQLLLREHRLGQTDALTGLLNARAFREIATTEVERGRRYPQPLSLAFIDVDDFKRVNDAGGHRAGDRLLLRIAELLRDNLRSSDTVARFGGDEFVILLPVADQAAAQVAMEKLSEKMRVAMTAERWPVTLSIGVITCLPGTETSADTMLERADRLMYEVKTGGKGSAGFATCDG